MYKNINSKEELIYLANILENCEMVAFTNIFSKKYLAIRNIIEEEKKKINSKYITCLINYKEKIKKEVIEIATDYIDIIDKYLIPNTNNIETLCYYSRNKGNYYKKLSNIFIEEENKYIELARSEYFLCDKYLSTLDPTNVLKLSYSLSNSCYFYEILNDPITAIKIARNAFNEAVVELENLEENHYKEIVIILQLIRDNILLWSNNIDQNYYNKNDGNE